MPAPTHRYMRFAKKYVFTFFGALCLLLVAGAITQNVLESRELDRFPPPGRWIDLGDHRLHINCVGPTGASPTIVLDAGGIAFSTTWGLIQPEVAKTARVCSYDRAGLGWSEPGPRPRNAEAAAIELHLLLLQSGETGPYLLVGHSYGGIVIRKYFDMHPNSVAGLVFVDPSFPKQRSLLSPVERDQIAEQLQRLRVLSFLGRFGISRLYPNFLEQTLPPTGYELFDTLRSWPRHIGASVDELERMDESLGYPAFATQDFEDRPMIVLSENVSSDRDKLRVKREEHRRLADRSQRGVHIVVDGASHISFVTDPRHAAVVVTAINEVLAASSSR